MGASVAGATGAEEERTAQEAAVRPSIDEDRKLTLDEYEKRHGKI